MTHRLVLLAAFATAMLAPAAEAKLLPKGPCVTQCKVFIGLDAACTRVDKHHFIHWKRKCLRPLVRQCRKGQPVCPLTTITTSTTTTTTTTTSTTTTTTSTTTTTTVSPDGGFVGTLDFQNGLPGGNCGTVSDGGGNLIKHLTCGGLSIGGGASTVGEGPTPDGSTSRFVINCAMSVGGVCTLTASATPPASQSADPDCTTTGCNFGTPLPIPNFQLRNLTTCVLNTWASPASGTINRDDGTSTTSVPLSSDIYLTGNPEQPCPACKAGACDRGINKGLPCVTVNSNGYTRDCPPGGVGVPPNDCQAGVPNHDYCADGSVHVGGIGVNLTPLTTATAVAMAADGKFCPLQGGNPGTVGCFNAPACRRIEAVGTPAGPITTGMPSTATLAATFCIAATPNGLVNYAADLPGPGAVTLPGTFTVKETR